MLLAILSITTGATFAKTLFPLIGAPGTTALRMIMAAIMLSVWQRIWTLRLTRQSALAGCLYGGALGCMSLLYYLAIERIPLGIALAFEFVGPLGVAIAFSRRKTDLAWAVLAVLGLALLIPLRGGPQALDFTGVACALAAGFFWGAYILAGRRAGMAFGAQATTVGMIVAALVVMPFGIASAGTALLGPEALMRGLVVAIISSAIPFSLEMYALKRLHAKSYGILTSMEPAMGALLGLLILGEQLSLAKWLGIAVIIAASLGTTLSNKQGHEPDDGASPLPHENS